MPDKEKLISALHCRAQDLSIDLPPCDGCDYQTMNHRGCDIRRICKDALDALKEQEPRVLEWDEVKNYSVVWVEFKDIASLYPMIITFKEDGMIESWNPFVNRSGQFLLLVSEDRERKNTRCWNHEPTAEQRKAAKWE